MKTYFTDIFEKFKRFSKKLDDITLLTNKHWVIINASSNSKIIYIFQNTGILLISTNGKVTKANWEYIGNNSLLIDINNDSFLYKQGFLDDNILALKIDSKQEYTLMVNENQFEKNINSFEAISELLESQYTLEDNFQITYNQQKIIEINNKQYRIIDGFNEELAVVLNENLDYGFINLNNELIKECKFEYAENFSCGLALVRYNNKFGFIDKTLNYRINPIYDHAKSFKNGIAQVTRNNVTFDINLQGKSIS